MLASKQKLYPILVLTSAFLNFLHMDFCIKKVKKGSEELYAYFLNMHMLISESN